MTREVAVAVDDHDLSNRRIRERFNLTAVNCREDGFFHKGLGIKVVNLKSLEYGLLVEKKSGIYLIDYDDAEKPHNFVYDNVRRGLKKCPVAVRAGEGQFEFVLNADDGDMRQEADLSKEDVPEDNLGFYLQFSSRPSVSFNCVARLLGTKPQKIPDLFDSKELSLADFSTDERRKVTSAEKELLSNVDTRGSVKPPEAGFSLIGSDEFWHRSGFVLLNSKTKSYLFGQDEGAYFGVELPKRVKTISKAFESLMPKLVRETTNYQRQGEWYIVHVDKKDVPPETEFVATFRSDQDYSDDYRFFSLNRDSLESAHHKVEADLIGITKKGEIYAKSGVMIHENGDHDSVYWTNWAILVRNLAVRSVSVKGVD